jgi:hypothetical protein
MTDEESTPTPPQETQQTQHADRRQGEVNPADAPVPANPPTDREAVEKGEEQLDRIVPG